MKKKLLLIVLPALMVLSGCSSPKTELMREDNLAHEEIFGAAEVAGQLGIRRAVEGSSEAPAEADLSIKMGYQTQLNNNLLSVRFIAGIKNANVTAYWHRGACRGSGSDGLLNSSSQEKIKFADSGNHASSVMYKSLKNGDATITAGQGEWADYFGFAIYTLTNIPYTNANKDAYLAAYLTLSDSNYPSRTVNSNVYAIKIEVNNDGTSTHKFDFASNTNGYFLYGTIGGQDNRFYPADDSESTYQPNQNFASYEDIDLTSSDNFGSFFFNGSNFRFCNFATYFEHSLGFFGASSTTSGFATPKEGGRYRLTLSSGDNKWWHVYTEAHYFSSDVTVWLVPNDDWKSADARFAAYFFADGKTEIWRDLVADGKIDNKDAYKVNIPAYYYGIIFCRMNPATTENNWNNKWTQTDNLDVINMTSTHSYFNITSWSGGSFVAF